MTEPMATGPRSKWCSMCDCWTDHGTEKHLDDPREAVAPGDERYYGGAEGEHLVTTSKRRFVHRRKDGEENTVCGAMPKFYRGSGLDRLTTDEAKGIPHLCKRCFPPPSPDRLAAHLKKKCDAVIAMHRPDESADDLIAQLQSEGWVLGETEIVEGKRVRYMHPPTTSGVSEALRPPSP